MPVRPRVRLLPDAPLVLLAVVALATAAQVAAAAGWLPSGLERHQLLLGLPAYAGLVVVLLWRGRTVPHERDMWSRVTWASAALTAVTAVGAALEAFPATQTVGQTVAWWAPLAAVFFWYDAIVRWNRYGTELADPGNVLTGIAAVFSWIALVHAVVDGVGSSGALTPAQMQPLTIQVAVGVMLLLTTSAQRVLADLRRDLRPVLMAGAFAAMAVTAVPTLAGVAPPRWIPVAGTVGCLCVAVAATLRPARSTPQPSNSTTLTIGAFVVVTQGTGVLIAGGLGDLSATTVSCAGLAVLCAGLQLLFNVRDLAQLATTRAEALTDHLTGLPNRRALLRRVEELGASEPVVLALLDLDRFKEVNDGLGHAAGDDLLRLVAARLAPALRSGDVLGRLGGDEFAVVAVVDHGASTEEAAERLCRRLQDLFAEPFLLGDLSVHVGASIGGTAGGRGAAGGQDTVQLLREADAAMYDAKRSGRGWALYDRVRHADSGTALTLVEELRAGIGGGQLVVHHQPQVDVGTGRVVGVEALVRWQHPRLGLLGPHRFLDLAEAHGLMGALTDEVLTQAVTQLAGWRAQHPDLRMSVNLSPSNLLDTDLPGRLAGVLQVTGVPAHALTLEVTESVLLRDPERSRATVDALRTLGVDISIDDFGTGYCSLAYLRELSVSELKLDRSFTADLLRDGRTEAIVASVVELAHRLGLRVVAEGVEDEVTLARLAELGCDQTQGYLHGRPAPADEVRLTLPVPV